MSKSNRRPQAPKRRNFVAKHAREFQKSHVHRDRTKYDRYEDDLQDRLNDFLYDDPTEQEEELAEEARNKAEFIARLEGDKYDPELKEEWERYKADQEFVDLEDFDYGMDDDYYGTQYEDYENYDY